jgi:hypothetical protein
MMDFQQIIALAIVAAAAVLLVLRYARGRRKPKFSQCADCAASSMHAPPAQKPAAHSPAAHNPGARDPGPAQRPGVPTKG